MGNLFEQKYPNNIRNVSGLAVIPFQDDSILVCNTALGAVQITLLSIPTNWSTQYKLYVVDGNNNASVNNITIVAPVGYLVNGGASMVISANGGSALIRVTSATNYIAQYSVLGGGGGIAGHVIADESVNLPQRPILDFQGAGVTVIDAVGRTIVTIPSGGTNQYLFAQKLLQDGAVAYVPPHLPPTRSILNGTVLAEYSSKVESGVTGFDLVSGVWTVPATGWYSVSGKLITRIDPLSVDSNADGVGLHWMVLTASDGGVGFMGIGLALNRSTVPQVLCSNKEVLTQDISDLNIDCSVEAVLLTVGDRVDFCVVNQTNHAIDGIPALAGQPDCLVQIAIKRVA